jgi:large subunit ribosomal protein L4
MNKKTRRVAIVSALSAKVAANEIIVVDKITTEDYKTKTMVNMLSAIGAGKKSLVVLSENDKRVIKSFDNIPGVKTTPSTIISVYDLINCDTVVADQNAIKTIEEVYA